MSATPFLVRKVAVLGAGVMGAQIAAHLVNANVEAILFELPAKEGDPNGNVLKAVDNLRKLEPSPLATAARAGLIRPDFSELKMSVRLRPGEGAIPVRAHGRPASSMKVGARSIRLTWSSATRPRPEMPRGHIAASGTWLECS